MEVISQFLVILQNQAFASSIKELVYDARLFWRRLEEPDVYERAHGRDFRRLDGENMEGSDEDEDNGEDEWEDGNSSANDLEIELHESFHFRPPLVSPASSIEVADTCIDRLSISESASRYSELLRQQNDILDQGMDLEILAIGLRLMPNLRSLAVLDGFNQRPDWEPFLWDLEEFDWYEDWSAELCEGIADPSPWIEAHFKDTANQFPWDFRGIDNLFSAIGAWAPKLRQLYLGSQLLNLSSTIYARPPCKGVLYNLAPRLSKLKLDCSLYNPAADERPEDYIRTIGGILKRCTQLQSLSITLDMRTQAWPSLLETLELPHLRVLDLGDGHFASQEFCAMAQRHRHLQELRLRNISIRVGQPWTAIAEKLGQILHLDLIVLLSLNDSGTAGSGSLNDEALKLIARAFMQRVPLDLLGYKSGNATSVVAWHLKDFKPTFDLESLRDTSGYVSD